MDPPIRVRTVFMMTFTVAAVVALFAIQSLAEDGPQRRGPKRDSISGESNLLKSGPTVVPPSYGPLKRTWVREIHPR